MTRAIVVSSGSSVLLHEAGNLIDNFDTVIRCNRSFVYNTEEYWKYTGKRTDWLALNPKNMLTREDREMIHNCDRYVDLKGIIGVNFDRGNEQWRNTEKWKSFFPDKDQYFITKEMMDEVFYGTGLPRSTCGVLAVLFTLSKFPEVWVYGFSPEKGCKHFYNDPSNQFFALTAPGVGNYKWLKIEEEFLRSYNNIHFLEDQLSPVNP